jgi:hypothetical protein
MKSAAYGNSTSGVEVTRVSTRGLWLLFDREELFLPFTEFPWFRRAAMEEVTRVERVSIDHIRWPTLDVDLTIESIRHPERFPLVSR